MSDLKLFKPRAVLAKLFVGGQSPAALGLEDHGQALAFDLNVGEAASRPELLQTDGPQFARLLAREDVRKQVLREGAALREPSADAIGEVVLLVAEQVEDRAYGPAYRVRFRGTLG